MPPPSGRHVETIHRGGGRHLLSVAENTRGGRVLGVGSIEVNLTDVGWVKPTDEGPGNMAGSTHPTGLALPSITRGRGRHSVGVGVNRDEQVRGGTAGGDDVPGERPGLDARINAVRDAGRTMLVLAVGMTALVGGNALANR